MNSTKSKVDFALKGSIIGGISQVISIIISFFYRLLFLKILSEQYLGLNGLFTNILGLFTLADLGINTAIIYRMYRPLEEKDIDYIAALMNFFKIVYRIIAIVIAIIGVSFIPFLNFFLKSSAEIPSDVNIVNIYLLFLVQVVSSYFFVYKQSLVAANQRDYINSLFLIISNILKITLQSIVLIYSHDYTYTLLTMIISSILLNYLYSIYITKKYSEIFSNKSKLKRHEIISILKDTFALMCHKIGGIILSSTDNLVISKFIGLNSVGIYSNYSMITIALSGLLNKAVSSITATIGNIGLSEDIDYKYKTFINLNSLYLWIVCFSTICLYTLINPFFMLFFDSRLILNNSVVFIICFNFFITMSRVVNTTFISACGLFNRDKIRPLIEVVLNIVVSVFLAVKIGISGVLMGTIISSFLTSWWRETYLLHKYVFLCSEKKYYSIYFKWFLITILSCYFVSTITGSIFSNSLISFVMESIFTAISSLLIVYVFSNKSESFKYFQCIITSKIKQIKGGK